MQTTKSFGSTTTKFLFSTIEGLKHHRASNGVVYKTVGQGRPLLLFHGSSGSWLHWCRNIQTLAKSHRVVAVDLPGYGESLSVAPDVSLDEYVNLVLTAALEASADPAEIDIAAFSFGGLIGAAVAAKLGNRARRTVLLAPSGFPKPDSRPLGRRPRSLFPSTEEGTFAYLRHNLLAMMLHNPESVDVEALEVQRWNLDHSRFNNQGISHSSSLPTILEQIRCPVLIAYGDKDPTPYPSAEARLEACRRAKSDIEYRQIPGGGHWVQFEQPAQTNRVISDFLCG
jgi:2-hydroxy-6-oxonona-2,4-dienedioate hydrolase